MFKVYVKLVARQLLYSISTVSLAVFVLGIPNAFSAVSTDFVWLEGTLVDINSTPLPSTKARYSIVYYLQFNKVKMRRLDLSKLKPDQWKGLITKGVTIKVSKQNHAAVLSGSASVYQVLSVRYSPASKLKKTPKQRALKAQALEQPIYKKPWLNLLCKFADIATEPHSSDYYQTMFGGTYPYLGHYWKETSFGVVDIAGTQTIDEWATLPHEHSYYKPAGSEDADIAKLKEDCINAANVSNNLDSYYGVNLFFNGIIFDRWSGLGGGGTTWIDLGAEGSLGVVAHEMGHAYGLAHSSGRYGNEYDSPWDVMSNAHRGGSFGVYRGVPQHTIAIHKQQLGIIKPRFQWDNAAFDASAGYELHLSRLEGEPNSGGSYLIAIINTVDGSKRYSIETRDKIDYDRSLPAKAVIIHEIDEIDENAYFRLRAYVVDPDNNGDLSDAGAQWQVGETFSDSANNISIEILSETATGYNIRVTAPKIKPIDVVDNITATNDLLDKVTVSWAPVSGATYYKVLRYDSWDFSTTFTELITTDSATSFSDYPNDFKLHYYQVKACNSIGCSPVGRYQYAKGSLLFSLSASDGDFLGKVEVSFKAASFIKEYILWRFISSSASGNRYSYVDSASTGPLIDNAVVAGVKYKYRISAIYHGETSSYFLDSVDEGYADTDSDADGIGNKVDTDDDNDGVLDEADAFPLDAAESVDTDGDGMGNNADTDDDNDGLPDSWEIRYGLDSLNASDASEDNDDDGVTNLEEYTLGTNPNGDAFTLDVDGDGVTKPLTDGLLVLRYQFGFRDNALLVGAVGLSATRKTASQIKTYFKEAGLDFDIDGDGDIKPLTDGLLTLRYLFGFRGGTLISGAVGVGATRRTSGDIEQYLQSKL